MCFISRPALFELEKFTKNNKTSNQRYTEKVLRLKQLQQLLQSCPAYQRSLGLVLLVIRFDCSFFRSVSFDYTELRLSCDHLCGYVMLCESRRIFGRRHKQESCSIEFSEKKAEQNRFFKRADTRERKATRLRGLGLVICRIPLSVRPIRLVVPGKTSLVEQPTLFGRGKSSFFFLLVAVCCQADPSSIAADIRRCEEMGKQFCIVHGPVAIPLFASQALRQEVERVALHIGSTVCDER